MQCPLHHVKSVLRMMLPRSKRPRPKRARIGRRSHAMPFRYSDGSTLVDPGLPLAVLTVALFLICLVSNVGHPPRHLKRLGARGSFASETSMVMWRVGSAQSVLWYAALQIHVMRSYGLSAFHARLSHSEVGPDHLGRQLSTSAKGCIIFRKGPDFTQHF